MALPGYMTHLILKFVFQLLHKYRRGVRNNFSLSILIRLFLDLIALKILSNNTIYINILKLF